MTHRHWILLILLILPQSSLAAFSNYNSVLIGDMASGMGGAFTALTGDPASCSYYNPATLARMRGTNLSATANIYNKYETKIGELDDLLSASSRINQGSFRSIPAASGSIAAFGSFALGVSIIVPDYDFFSGTIPHADSSDTFLNLTDESLWSGGTVAYNITDHHAVGLTMYYTARYHQRSLVDELIRPDDTTRITTEEKTFFNNSLIYILGYHYQVDNNWSFGTSIRFPSLEVSGRGKYFRSTLDTAPAAPTTPSKISSDGAKSETRIPPRYAFGVAYTEAKRRTFSLDVTVHGSEQYKDFGINIGAEHIKHNSIWNVAGGMEWYLRSWLRFRGGVFTNFSSHPPIESAEVRKGDHIDMWGFSANLGVFTSDKVSFTFGGYYTGGTGNTVEFVGDEYRIVKKSRQIYSMLIGTAYFF
jgi:long-subunit fatty acid transport protein